ncbi:TolB family protein [Roseateles sp. LYH14W]|uniref:TolB family protein n=1 Tax=Pelomonas parva TaxID=3299032 RepID=A0ABW7FA63_9BURK
MTSTLAPRPSLLALSLIGLCGAAHAAPLQLSSGNTNSFGPSLSADGSRLAFYSASDLTGSNADRNFEVFVYDRAPAQLRQITDQPGGGLAGGNQAPSLSGDGSRLVFQHFVINGSIANFQTQSYDLNTNTLTTLTSPGMFESSAISRDGKLIAVNTDNLGLRFYDTTTQSFSSVVMSAPFGFSMSGDGGRIAYEGFSQGVRLLDVASGTTTIVSPAGSGFNQGAALSADGNSLAFVSTFDPLGLNADGNSELFRYDVLTQTLAQVTQTSAGNAQAASVSGDGSRIAFGSSADLTGGNADGNTEIFVYDLLAGSFLQLTDTLGAFSTDAVLSEDGLSIAYVSTMNLNGANPSGAFQVFMDVLAPQDSGRLPEPASLALVLAALGLLPAVRRLRRSA